MQLDSPSLPPLTQVSSKEEDAVEDESGSWEEMPPFAVETKRASPPMLDFRFPMWIE